MHSTTTPGENCAVFRPGTGGGSAVSPPFYRSVFYPPSLLAGSVAVAILWKQIFGTTGLVNQFLALVGIEGPAGFQMFTVPVALRAFVDATASTSWGSLFAMSIVSLLPVFIAFLLGQRFLVKGIATTGIK